MEDEYGIIFDGSDSEDGSIDDGNHGMRQLRRKNKKKGGKNRGKKEKNGIGQKYRYGLYDLDDFDYDGYGPGSDDYDDYDDQGSGTGGGPNPGEGGFDPETFEGSGKRDRKNGNQKCKKGRCGNGSDRHGSKNKHWPNRVCYCRDWWWGWYKC